MKLFLFHRIKQVSEYYHSDGGLVIVANNAAHARAIIADMEHIEPTDEEWAHATVYDLEVGHDEYEPRVYVFPDAGCC